MRMNLLLFGFAALVLAVVCGLIGFYAGQEAGYQIMFRALFAVWLGLSTVAFLCAMLSSVRAFR